MGKPALLIAIVLAIAIVSAAIFGARVLFFASLSPSATTSIAQGSTPTTSSTTTETGSITTVCTILAEGNLLLDVLNSSDGKPLGSVPVRLEHVAPICPPNPRTTENLGWMRTNASGFLTIWGLGEYYLLVGYSGRTYSVNESIGPERATCVTLSIPSGQVSVQYSGSFQSDCSPYSSSTTTQTSFLFTTTTTTDPAGTTTTTECSTTQTATVTQLVNASYSYQTTITYTVTETHYGTTISVSGCEAVTSTVTTTRTT